ISGSVDWEQVAKACGYKNQRIIYTKEQLKKLVAFMPGELIVIKVSMFSRSDLGRPTTTAKENIINFMKNF
ncbi:MAG: phosphonopyruvate decarboxylase, partial [Firmicutes bacterium]|nr:phosphonopyruvate decarboxylase [Bacillota bacterium]